MSHPPFDSELAEILEPILFAPKVDLTADFILQQRETIELTPTVFQIYDEPELSHDEVKIPGPGGEIVLSVLRSKTSTKESSNPGVYHIHGGGMVLGNRFHMIKQTFPIIKEFGVALISVEYRLAPGHPAPAAVEDCYAGLQWVFENATKLGIDVSRTIIIGGRRWTCSWCCPS